MYLPKHINTSVSLGFVLVIAFSLLMTERVHAQADTLQTAQTMVREKKFKDAAKLLRPYAAAHSDVNTVWYAAQTAYWAGQDIRAGKTFRKALSLSPQNNKLRLDYARMLFEADRLNGSRRQIDTILSTDEKNIEARQLKANIAFWHGKTKAALDDLNKIFEPFPSNAAASALYYDIKLNTSPYLSYSAGYLNDDQPMQSVSSKLEAGWYRSWLLNPKLQIVDQDLYADGKWNFTIWVNAGNKFLFGRSGTSVTINAGVFKNFSANTDWTGSVAVRQKLYRYLSLDLSAERRPYLYTLHSASQSLMQNRLGAAFTFDKSNSWTAQASYYYQFFSDKNPVQNAFLWFLSPPIKASVFQFRFGYSYNFSTSSESRFTSVKTITEIITNYDASAPIKGVYNPYFTPIKQHIHSAIADMKISPHRMIDIGIKANVGFYAQAQNPYLYLDKNPVDALVINTGYSKEVFFPYTVSASFDIKPSKRFAIGADYSYSHLFFYNYHLASIHFRVIFLKK